MVEPETREEDRRNGHQARARQQAERAENPRVIEHPDGSVHRLKSTTLVIPEERRCQALTVRGDRCKVGRMRGLKYCIFHGHLAATDENLGKAATDEKTRLSPRAALQAVVRLRAEELADAAVRGALQTDGPRATSAVLALVDAVDPLVVTEQGLTLTAEGMEQASYRQLAQVFASQGL